MITSTEILGAIRTLRDGMRDVTGAATREQARATLLRIARQLEAYATALPDPEQTPDRVLEPLPHTNLADRSHDSSYNTAGVALS